MTSIELSLTQREILRALVNGYTSTGTTIKGERLAEKLEKSSGTLRNQMQNLKALQLVEGVPGPGGGYKPTPTAFDVLHIQDVDHPAEVPLKHNGDPVEKTNVESINLTSVHHPTECTAEVTLQSDVDTFEEADLVTVGPTPLSKLQLVGVVEGKDAISNTLILSIVDMLAPAE